MLQGTGGIVYEPLGGEVCFANGHCPGCESSIPPVAPCHPGLFRWAMKQVATGCSVGFDGRFVIGVKPLGSEPCLTQILQNE